jgi:hypothetical protein
MDTQEHRSNNGATMGGSDSENGLLTGKSDGEHAQKSGAI